jgi:tRNA A37 threonylcarbamoyladenosine biosynthesis protein TsaE
VTVIEWPEHIDGLLDLSDLLIDIEHRTGDERIVTIRRR